MGERLTVQFARGTRNRDAFAATERTAPRPRRTPHRMQISGLPGETSWQVCSPRSFFRTIGNMLFDIIGGTLFEAIGDMLFGL